MTPISVAVIGAGPGGMFFCHAIEHMKKETDKEIQIKCFERSSRPGGVWRAADPKKSSKDNTDMYDKLWTNGSSHCIEFFDYTLDEHFGKPVTVYMKREDLLGYMVGRVTKNCPDFFEKYMQFESEVVHVKYDESTQQFGISVKDLKCGETTIEYFDKCIWACGKNGKQKIPQSLVNLFRNGGFEGTIMHSADTANLEESVKGKRILLVGGGFSAEDLALQSIKLGVNKVYVSTRYANSEVTWTTRWPKDKVEVLRGQEPLAVTDNGRCIEFQEVEWTLDGYVNYDEGSTASKIYDIDTIILCTGYHPCVDFFDESLSKGIPGGENYFSATHTFDAPKGWKMPSGFLSELTGEVELSNKLRYPTWYLHPEFYRGVLISNPNMMYICEYASDHPLLAIETYSWLLARFITGLVEMPSQKEMIQQNRVEIMDILKYPYFRYLMDRNYYKKVTYLPNFWSETGFAYPELWNECVYEYEIVATKRLAGMMQQAKYPFSIGTRNKLNANGQALLDFGEFSYNHRAHQSQASEDEKEWKTFRDYRDGHNFYSLFTGTRAVSLEERWLDQDKNES